MLSYFRNKKIFNQQKKEVLEIMKKFVEGKISSEDFWIYYKENETVYKLLIKCKDLSFSVSQIENINISKLQGRIQLYSIIKKYFKINKIRFKSFNIEEDRYNFICEILEDWDLSEDIDYINDLIKSIPDELSKEDLKIRCQKELAKNFRFDEYPPCWLTSCSWPIVNGKPLIFKKMNEKQIHDLIINEFIFYDEITKKETVVIQSDYN